MGGIEHRSCAGDVAEDLLEDGEVAVAEGVVEEGAVALGGYGRVADDVHDGDVFGVGSCDCICC